MEERLDFTTLKKRLEVTDGALGAHLSKLEEAGYVRSDKTFVGRRPRTYYLLETRGRRALSAYLESMRTLVSSIESSNPST